MKGKKRMILKFTDRLPGIIYLDASVILNAAMTGGRFHEKCSSFMRRIRDEGVRCVTATLTFDEIWYVLIKNRIHVGIQITAEDSIHLAVSVRHRIMAIATTNQDFINAAEMVDIYTSIHRKK